MTRPPRQLSPTDLDRKIHEAEALYNELGEVVNGRETGVIMAACLNIVARCIVEESDGTEERDLWFQALVASDLKAMLRNFREGDFHAEH